MGGAREEYHNGRKKEQEKGTQNERERERKEKGEVSESTAFISALGKTLQGRARRNMRRLRNVSLLRDARRM